MIHFWHPTSIPLPGAPKPGAGLALRAMQRRPHGRLRLTLAERNDDLRDTKNLTVTGLEKEDITWKNSDFTRFYHQKL
jgi:hypothetical protein